MINIEITKLDDNIKHISIKGHAQSAKYGNDLVCCAVSVLSQSIVNAMIKALDFREDFFSISNNGNLEIDIPDNLTDIQLIKMQTLADVLDINLKDLSKQYRKYIIFKEKRGFRKC